MEQPRDLNVTALQLFVSYVVMGRLTLTGTFNADSQLTAHSLAEPGFNNSYPFVHQHFVKGYGDTLLTGKYRFQRSRDNIGGISFRGFVKFGTADAKTGLATGATNAGADVIFTSRLPFKFVMDSNIGYTSNGDAKDPATNVTRRLKNGLRSYGFGRQGPGRARR